jgi:hypothetical protein
MRQNDCPADHLVCVARVDAQAHRKVNRLIKLGVFNFLQEGNCLGQCIGRQGYSRTRLRNVLAGFLCHFSSSPTVFANPALRGAISGGGTSVAASIREAQKTVVLLTVRITSPDTSLDPTGMAAEMQAILKPISRLIPGRFPAQMIPSQSISAVAHLRGERYRVLSILLNRN